jgi:molybdopterin-guanine dinucleotide biosynthesis protein A
MKSKLKEPQAGIILCGGKSSRMGKDKASLSFLGRPLIKIVIDSLKTLFSKIIVVTNDTINYQKYNLPIIKDILPQKGPLGGIYTGLLYSKSKYNFVVACDMPFINLNLIRYLFRHKDDCDLIIPYFKVYQPLYAIYSKNCISAIEESIFSNNLEVKNLINMVKVKVIDEKQVCRFDKKGLCFTNINTPQEFEEAKKISYG